MQFRQCFYAGEQIGAKSQSLTLNGAAYGSKGGREQVNRSKMAVCRLLCFDRGVDKAVVKKPLVIFRYHALEIAIVHGFVVAYDDDGGVFVKGLCLNPFHKFSHLPAGAERKRLRGTLKIADILV